MRARSAATKALAGGAALLALGPAPVPGGNGLPSASRDLLPVHIELESSVPARDTTIRVPLDGVILVFSGPVEARLSRVRWVGSAGDTLVLAVSPVPDQPHVLSVEPPPAAHGAQLLAWSTVSADGHQASGEIPFTGDFPELAAAADAATAEVDSPAVAPVVDPAAGTAAGSEDGASRLRIAMRGLGIACLLAFAGLLWFEFGSTLLAEARPHRAASAAGLGAALFLSLDVVLWLSELRVPGTSLADTLGIVVDTRTGAAEVGRAALAAAAFLAFSGTRAHRFGALLAMLAVLMSALGGHQATIEPLLSLVANGLHVGAAAVWMGGLALLASWPAASIGGESEATGWTFERVTMRVSSAALLASGLILVTAIAQDLLYLPSIASVFSTDYGTLVLAKGAGFVALVGFGAYHRFRLIPRLEAGRGDAALQRSVRLELLVMVIVVFVAVALSQTPPPVE